MNEYKEVLYLKKNTSSKGGPKSVSLIDLKFVDSHLI